MMAVFDDKAVIDVYTIMHQRTGLYRDTMAADDKVMREFSRLYNEHATYPHTPSYTLTQLKNHLVALGKRRMLPTFAKRKYFGRGKKRVAPESKQPTFGF